MISINLAVVILEETLFWQPKEPEVVLNDGKWRSVIHKRLLALLKKAKRADAIFQPSLLYVGYLLCSRDFSPRYPP